MGDERWAGAQQEQQQQQQQQQRRQPRRRLALLCSALLCSMPDASEQEEHRPKWTPTDGPMRGASGCHAMPCPAMFTHAHDACCGGVQVSYPSRSRENTSRPGLPRRACSMCFACALRLRLNSDAAETGTALRTRTTDAHACTRRARTSTLCRVQWHGAGIEAKVVSDGGCGTGQKATALPTAWLH